MAENDKLHIKLHVYDTDISVNAPRQDEEYYRKAGKLITDTVNTYASLFKNAKSTKDLLYMALIDITLRYEKLLAKEDTTRYDDILGQLTKEIEQALDDKA